MSQRTTTDALPILLDVPAAAAYLQVPQGWVRRAIRTRVIPMHKVGRYVRISVDDLEAYLRAQRVEARNR